jgi:hypothetical protein
MRSKKSQPSIYWARAATDRAWPARRPPCIFHDARERADGPIIPIAMVG